MSCTKLSPPAEAVVLSRSNSAPPVRPRFNSKLTSDRLRESWTLRLPPFRMGGKIRKGRRSVFKELGLENDGDGDSPAIITTTCPTPTECKSTESSKAVDERSFGEITGLISKPRPGDQKEEEQQEEDCEEQDKEHDPPKTSFRQQRPRQNSWSSWYAKIASPKSRPRIKSTSSAPPGAVSGPQRFTMLAVFITIVLPAFGWFDLNGVDAGTVARRQDSPTEVCARWAHQAALLNGTLYIYGGRAKTQGAQESNTWNNCLLTLDLTRDWETGSPRLKGLQKPDGPPAVAMGYLWHDYNSLYLYGGQFSDSPYIDPEPESLWRYSISDGRWTAFPDPKTSAGNYSEPADQPVHRAAEGAGLSVPELGLSWYFGGHLDWATTPGWSRDVDRVYLKTLLEFTHPGYVNSGVESLSDGTGAGEWGAFRNISRGGVQAGEFPERADGVLAFVPGWGEAGVLIGLAGGTGREFTHDLGVLDVYDIANSEWFHQETEGEIPDVRVNPCAVVASAPDASSFQVYMFGGQNLQPYANQTQYDDMYILTIPSFTWIKVARSDKTPTPRAGHTCTLYDGQIVVVGGYIGNNEECDSGNGIYIFDATTLTWKTSFQAGDHAPDFHPDNAVLAASFGYAVPQAVQDVIGGGHDGGATATTPASGPATAGPFLTGKPPVFTVTQSGATATITGDAGSDAADVDSDAGNDANPRLVAAGVIAGVLGAGAVYLGWCTWLYRRQVRTYRRHLAIMNRYSGTSTTSLVPPAHSGRTSPESFAWVGHSDGPSSSSCFPSEGKQSEEMRPATAGSGNSTDGLLEGQEPSFVSVVMGPRRALRVVNGVE